MIGLTTEFVLARHRRFFQLYRSDVSWQSVGSQCYVELMAERMKSRRKGTKAT